MEQAEPRCLRSNNSPKKHLKTALHRVALLIVRDGWALHVLVSVHACFPFKDTDCSSLPRGN
jgi:hypothetical protein